MFHTSAHKDKVLCSVDCSPPGGKVSDVNPFTPGDFAKKRVLKIAKRSQKQSHKLPGINSEMPNSGDLKSRDSSFLHYPLPPDKLTQPPVIMT